MPDCVQLFFSQPPAAAVAASLFYKKQKNLTYLLVAVAKWVVSYTVQIVSQSAGSVWVYVARRLLLVCVCVCLSERPIVSIIKKKRKQIGKK